MACENGGGLCISSIVHNVESKSKWFYVCDSNKKVNQTLNQQPNGWITCSSGSSGPWGKSTHLLDTLREEATNIGKKKVVDEEEPLNKGFGDIVEEFSKRKSRAKNLVASDEVDVEMDVENFRTDIPSQHSLESFRGNLLSTLQTYNPKMTIKRMTAVGNLNGYYGKHRLLNQFKSDDWPGANRTIHIVPRTPKCSKCSYDPRDTKTNLSKPLAVKYASRCDLADCLLIDIIYEKYLDDGATTFLLISGDGDFAQHVTFLRRRNCRVILAMPKTCSRRLKDATTPLQFPLDVVLSLG